MSAGGRARQRRRAGPPRWIWGVSAIIVLVGIVVVWQVARSRAETTTGPGGVPGPLGGSDVAQDVNTLIGKRAPGFTLPDSEGKAYSVTPGQGRPLVLVFHMGIT